MQFSKLFATLMQPYLLIKVLTATVRPLPQRIHTFQEIFLKLQAKYILFDLLIVLSIMNEYGTLSLTFFPFQCCLLQYIQSNLAHRQNLLKLHFATSRLNFCCLPFSYKSVKKHDFELSKRKGIYSIVIKYFLDAIASLRVFR